ncbi:U11/U12 small nuclear ribonucleoprotein 25 kDa protein-like [Hyposmocoma kahamanoa]|uniref:U11/U12 small nuclear ribonucleoprotein 25 kDa protein-like n=1 Tax=Hyposmocoma kahamanoa TaxID=1477025 RepID=UPI000E6D6C87|nr:U11/U12 small nuclear ribonucleoprotein 25 kDa protein-like [Hyposmocoma kahamanoa]
MCDITDSEGSLAATLSHDELLEITQSSISTLLTCDPLLSDLPPDITLEEVLSQIAVEHGQAITIFINREDEPVLKVVVPQSATVSDLKKAIARHFEIYQKRIKNKVKISWKYIWKTYDLNYEGLILDCDHRSIDEYGVTNKVTLTFKKRRKRKRI